MKLIRKQTYYNSQKIPKEIRRIQRATLFYDEKLNLFSLKVKLIGERRPYIIPLKFEKNEK